MDSSLTLARAGSRRDSPPAWRRAFRGLALGLTLSALNLIGTFLAITALSGLGDWSRTQFVGVFGFFEVATGIAFIIGPNIWRLPVAEASTSSRTKVRLAASTIFIPHWAAGAKAAAGLALLTVAFVTEGVGPETAAVPILVFYVVAIVVALSLVFARVGVDRPELDVFQIKVSRPGGREHAFKAASIGAMVVQFLLNITVFPTVKLVQPSVFYQPEVGPPPAVLLGGFAVTAAFIGAALWAWRGRISWQAPAEQQREAERDIEEA